MRAKSRSSYLPYPYEHHKSKLLTGRQFASRLVRHAVWVACLITVSIAGGMIGYVWFAQLRWVDAFENTAMLLGGMGPIAEMPTDAAKIFDGVYALYAGLVFIASASILIAPVAHRILHRLHLEQ